uniref:Uncharacterized protein n=1 Tax=Oryza brachyantha TaxID=4533 RepID=J3M9T5_ORYBR
MARVCKPNKSQRDEISNCSSADSTATTKMSKRDYALCGTTKPRNLTPRLAMRAANEFLKVKLIRTVCSTGAERTFHM